MKTFRWLSLTHLIAYGKIAHAWREQFTLPVAAVTGSVGKTTMKEMIALTLSPLGLVLKSEKNENNEVGLPLTPAAALRASTGLPLSKWACADSGR